MTMFARYAIRFTVLGAAGLMLAGCLSPEEQLAQDRAGCISYGFVDGTDAFANCMMETRFTRDERSRQDQARWRAESERRRERDEDARRAKDAQERYYNELRRSSNWSSNPNAATSPATYPATYPATTRATW